MSKNAIKIFTDFLHHIDVNTEELKLTEVLETLFFLHYEGKTVISEVEKNLAEYLYDDLVERQMSDEVYLMVSCYLSMMDNPNTTFEETKFGGLSDESMKNIHITFAMESEPYLPIVQSGFIVCKILLVLKTVMEL